MVFISSASFFALEECFGLDGKDMADHKGKAFKLEVVDIKRSGREEDRIMTECLGPSD